MLQEIAETVQKSYTEPSEPVRAAAFRLHRALERLDASLTSRKLAPAAEEGAQARFQILEQENQQLTAEIDTLRQRGLEAARQVEALSARIDERLAAVDRLTA